jgi:hypothetical protein
METIFDHNVTEEELVLLLGSVPDKEEYINGKSQESHYRTLYRLCLMRGDKAEAKKYFDKLPDTIDKYFSLGNHCTSV